ncbi:S8 family peptidase [Thalassotalea sp. PLHSN55]|uniref:S8 family peptidase n=1 Tax=Thalassotalea sp. PLHSN55 TaxID=3435888 RepID=UPI003F8502B8
MSNRLIVKTSKKITKAKLQQYHQQISKVTELFIGQKYHYYAVEIIEKDLLSKVLTEFADLPEIKLVQPDILQLKQKSAIKNNTASLFESNEYINQLNLPKLWQSTKGAGIKIAIIDDGFALKHPDLKHLKPLLAYDVTNKKLTAHPLSRLDNHGTKVAGIIFAQHNNIGIDGIAPEADIIALRQPDSWTSNTLLSFHLAALAGADIINCSWHSQWLLQPVAEIVTELAQTGRNGKGIAVIFSSGNQGKQLSQFSSEASIAEAIVVGAADQYGNPLRFSNYGASVDLLNYGKNAKTTLRLGKYGNFSGTSLASSITSGLAALLLSKQPELTVSQLLAQLKLLTSPIAKQPR